MTSDMHPLNQSRLVSAPDPSELLASAVLHLPYRPVDCLVLWWEETQGVKAHASTIPLDVLADPLGRPLFDMMLREMQAAHDGPVHPILLLGNGHGQDDAEIVGECASVLGARVLTCMANLAPQPMLCSGIWTLGGGVGIRTMLLGTDEHGLDLALSPPVPVCFLESTQTVAEAVLAGVPLPRSRREIRECVASTVDLERLEVPRRAPDPDHLLSLCHGADEEVHRLGEALWRPRSSPRMTKCDHLTELLGTFALPGAALRVIATADLVGYAFPEGMTESAETIIAFVRTEPESKPGCDVIPGGRWFELFVDLLDLCVDMMARQPLQHAAQDVEQAQRELLLLLTLLAWWAHRRVSAANFLSELEVCAPDHPLAPLLATVIDTHAAPCWWPETP